jgi:hypothetical protein
MKQGQNAEQRFVNDWGLEPWFFSGLGGRGLLPWQRDSYAILPSIELSAGPSDGGIEAIEMIGNLRFGNSFISLVQALTVAQILGVNHVSCSHQSVKFSGRIGNIMVTKEAAPTRNRLSGIFFYPQLLNPLLSRAAVTDWWESPFASNPEVFALYGIELSHEPLGENDLVIHLRSGDVFKSGNPHPSYGQPPLAFYKKVVQHRDWRKVVLVYEDEANPVIRGLKGYLTSKKVPYVVSSEDPAADVNLCLRGRHLVMSVGTFLWPVVAASTNVESIYVFKRSLPWDLKSPEFGTTRCKAFLVSDKVGIYRRLVLRKWRNSRFQRLLLSWYPTWGLSGPHPRRNGQEIEELAQ